MTAIVPVCDNPLKRSAYLLFKSRNNPGKRVAVIRVSREGCDMSDKLSAF